MNTYLSLIAIGIALLKSPEARARLLEPIFISEAREHGIPLNALQRIAERESGYRWWVSGDHNRSHGLMQVRRDAVPWLRYSKAELLDPRTNVHAACLKLELARRRCGGGPERFAAAYNGRRCGSDPYGLRRNAIPTEVR